MDILQLSLSASVLIVAVVIIRALTLRKLPKNTFLVLWGVVICRLLIPFSIPSRFSFYTGVDMAKHLLAGKTAVSFPMEMTGIPNMVNMPEAGERVGMGAAPVSVSPVEIIWLIGMCACALFFIVAYIKCCREFKMSLPVENDFAALWLREHPLRRPVQIRQSGCIKAPLTYGVFRPVILLPRKTDWTAETKLRYILTHEFVHIRRFDTLTKLVLTAIVCVHWFNPFVWVMYVLANRDIELSCDETVVRTFGETTKSAYALTLIGLEEKKNRLNPLVNNFSKNAIEERVVSIMELKKSSRIMIAAAILLVAGTVIIFATSRVSQANSGSSQQSLNKTNTNILKNTSEISGEILTFFNDLGCKYELRFIPQYAENGVFASWNDVLLYLYKSGYSRGGAMKIEDVEQNIHSIFGTKAVITHQSTEDFTLAGNRYIPGGIAYSGNSAYEVVALEKLSKGNHYRAELLQYNYGTTGTNDDPGLTSNTHILGGMGQWENGDWKNKAIIADLIESQNTKELISSRSIDITFSMNESNNEITLNSVAVKY
ncbi:regulatory sensor-transducer [Desulfocucumis palustris]|uniref:Regulatory sensor-transducer n=1 Tax=Desulfocucumis palustris TaxID=1898651 RepID=A0A2L2XFQ8_9FIRM|nr:M56 family metallopeptidase [Desulfocucumis palustris]GBF34844.1 regulatory sensor-transducer [Desulfocucumis palustris]